MPVQSFYDRCLHRMAGMYTAKCDQCLARPAPTSRPTGGVPRGYYTDSSTDWIVAHEGDIVQHVHAIERDKRQSQVAGFVVGLFVGAVIGGMMVIACVS